MRTLTVLLIALLTITPAAALAPAASPVADAAPALAATLQDAASLQALAASYPVGAGLGAQLATATGASTVASEAGGFEDAMRALYAEAGLALAPDYERPAPELAAALAPVVGALTTSARLTNAGFAGLTPDERAFVLANIDLLLAPTADAGEEAARVASLSARVDVGMIRSGAVTLASALDAFEAPWVAAAWVAPGGLIEVGSTGNDAYCAERLLIIDLGGNDRYDCHPASYAPGSSLPLPVSVILDLGGNDVYTTLALHMSSATSTWGQGVGIGGIGIIADRWGDDVYLAQLYDAASWCAWDFFTGSPQYVYAQAVGALGVGAILDASGNDYYQTVNVNDLNVSCHFGWVYTFAQAVGLVGGVGLLVDDTGDDTYFAYTRALGKYDNIAATFSQAAAASGLAVLADKEGSDSYFSESDGFVTFGLTKGAFAYVFSQASVAATRKQPPAPTSNVGDAFGTPRVNCPTGSGGQVEGSGDACDPAGAAILIDLLGNDSFYATTYADDQNAGCFNGLWSVVSAQGSASWSGIAALVDLDVEGRDSFTLAPYAKGNGCGGPGTRAHAYGQGYGGPILWNFWDQPQPTNSEQVGVGILASLGVPEETCPGTLKLPPVGAPIGGIVDGGLGVIDINTPIADLPVAAPCKLDAPKLTASPDSYVARAEATNPSYIADARVYAQGASNRVYQVPAWFYSTFPVIGVGVHVDVGGDDSFDAQAIANGAIPDTLVWAQGATNAAFAALANVGGTDVYFADALQNGVSQPWLTLVQGYADAGGSISTPGPICVSVGPLFVCLQPIGLPLGTGIATFVEVFGYDTFSEAAERAGCMPNGTLLGTWPVGIPLGAVWWGHLIGNPCPITTPDVGTGLVVGLDWWSEAS